MPRAQPSSDDTIIKVLHVDDEPNHLKLSKMFLELSDPNIHVVSTSSPEEALSMIESFDCLVSDYKMPELNGINLTRRIRKTSDIPLILYTGRGSEEVAEAAFTVGVDDYVRKEVNHSHYKVLAHRIRAVVEKHKAEEGLRESEARYRGFISASRDGVEVFSGTALVFANLQAARLHGIDTAKELIEVGPLECVVPEDREDIRRRALTRQKGQDVSHIHEFRVRHTNGTIRWLESSSSLIDYEGRKSTLTFIRDITERKRMEEALHESMKKYADIVREIPSGMFIYQFQPPDQLIFLDGNVEAERLTGLKREELIGKEFDDVWHPKRPVPLKEIYLNLLETGETFKSEDVFWRDERIEGFFRIHAFRIPGERLCVNFENITERKRMEERLSALHRSAIKLAKTETLEDIAQLTFDTVEQVFGFRWGDFSVVEGSHLAPIFVKDIDAGEKWAIPLDGPGVIARATRTGESQLVPDTRLDGDYIPALIEGEPSLSELAVPVKVNDGVFGVINIESPQLQFFTDGDQKLVETIAEQVASAIIRIKKVEELEALVSEKTSELLNAERMASAGKVASMVGHDLRGPLQTIKNSLFLLRETPEKVDEWMDAIDEAVDYAVNMLDDLRVNIGGTPLQLQESNLGAIVQKAVEETSAPDAVEIELNIGDNMNAVALDPVKIRRVLDNLIRNAVEAMPEGGILEVSAQLDDSGNIVIQVRETGTGIPEDLMQDIFSSFVTTKSKGMGLGLSYCKRAVEAHGGSIAVESKVGEGTTFTIKLPLKYA